MTKRFGIDIDGTVTSPSALLPFINSAFGLNITLDDVKQYDLNPLVNVSKKELADWFMHNEPTIYAESPIALDAAKVLNHWKNKYELYFISARAPRLLDITEQWFIKHSLSYNQIELIGSHNKIEACKKYKVDIFFEDKHDNALAIHEECKIPVLLFDTPYNRDPIPDGVFRVYNWSEACQWVEDWLK